MVLDRIKKLGADKAVGPDNISGRMLKLCADSIAPVLARIFNISIASGKLPMEWKTAHVVPVYKKGDRSTLTDYRPIALTSIVVKMLESLVCDKLRNHLLTNGLMFENQHGLSPGKSDVQRPSVKLPQNGLLLSIVDQVRLHGLISYLWTTAAHLTQFRMMFLSVNFTKPTAFVDRFCNGLHPSLQVVANVLCFAVLVLIWQRSYLGCPRAPF